MYIKAQEKLDAIVQKNNSLVCVGLDSDFAKLPKHLKTEENPQFGSSPLTGGKES